MLKNFKRPHLLFFPLIVIFSFVIFFVDKHAAAVMMGSIFAFILDPSIFITGLLLGILGKTYKHFSKITYPVASLVTVILTYTLINPWQLEVSGQNVPAWVYIYRIFSVVIVSHIVFSIKKEILIFKKGNHD